MSGQAHGTGPGPRREVAREARERPHLTENDRDAPVQRQTQSPDDVPVLPANASGRDTQSTGQQPRDDASMYDGRPGEDKDRQETDMP
jgi:hypothetical protein